MAKDVLITPLEGLIQFSSSAGTGSGQIKVDNDDLVISNLVGDVLLGDGASDVFIGNGTDNVDIVFEQNGEIRDDGSGKTITIGSKTTTLILSSSSDLTLQGGGGNVGIGTSTSVHPLQVEGNISGSGTLHIDGNISTSGSLKFPTPSESNTNNGIVFFDTSSNAPNTKVNAIKWDFSNDDAFIYAIQSQSDSTYMVNELADNVVTDKAVWWFNNFAGPTTDSFPLMLEGNKAVINYYYDRRATFHRDSKATNGESAAVDFYLLKSGSTSVSEANSLIFGDVTTAKVTMNGALDITGNISASATGSFGKMTIGTTTMAHANTQLTIVGGSNGNDIAKFTRNAAHGAAAVPFVAINANSADPQIRFYEGSDQAAIGQDATNSNLVFATGSKISEKEAMVIQNDGDVGIGTISPSAKLEVSGSGITIHNGNQDGVLKIQRFSGDIGQLSAANTRFTLRALSNKNISIEDDAGNVGVFVKDGGKVGIGSDTTPTTALQVTGDISASGVLKADTGISSSGDIKLIGGANDIIFGEPGDTTSQNYGIKTDGNLFLDIDKDNDNTGNFFQFRSNQATTNIMRITDTGEVGIGTQSPPKTLTVQGDISASGDASIGTAVNQSGVNAYGTLQVNQNADNDESGIGIQNRLNGRSLRIYVDSSNNSVLNSGDGGGQPLILNEGAGKVGIGTTTLPSVLTIDGDMKATHITASGNISASGTIQGNSYEIQGRNALGFAGGGGGKGLLFSSGNITQVEIGKSGTTTLTNIIGNITASGDISGSGEIFAKVGQHRFEKTSNTDADAKGDVVFFGGTTSMTRGRIYHYKSDGTWEQANPNAASTSDGLLAVALGTASDTNGMLLRGTVTLDHDPGAVGDVLYLNETAAPSDGSFGRATDGAPAGNGDIVRVIGYCLDGTNGQIYFNPDNTFVEVST